CDALRLRGLTVLCVAYSGIAAQLLPEGRTANSTFKSPFYSPCSEKRVNIIIWDLVNASHKIVITHLKPST
ncbi:hypothetical protein EDB89DRAFT_1852062, partial [Lactarius sanguifluus]